MKTRSAARSATRWWTIPALALLVACGGLGGPSSANLQITGVEATSQSSITLRFNQPVGDGSETPSNYSVTGPGGIRLGVLAAYRAEDGRAVALATEPQQLVTYTVTVRDISTASGGAVPEVTSQDGFTGSSEVAPIVASAVALDHTKLLVTFADPASGTLADMGDGALVPAYYRISDPDLEILGAVYATDSDKARVILTTRSMTELTYTVRATNVRSVQGGKLVDPFLNSATFRGITRNDTQPPEVADAYATGNTTAVVGFSEPVADDATDPTAYTITDPDANVLRVVSVALNEFKTEATLTTWPMTPGVTYDVVVDGVTDRNGNPIVVGAESFVGAALDATTDVIGPRVLSANSTGPTTVVVTFDEPVAGGLDSAENPANYSIVDTASALATGAGGISTQGIVVVLGAVLSANQRTVTLQTMAQTEIGYSLQVTDVKDLVGNLVRPPDRDNPYHVTFFGTGASGSPADSDGDGLSDAEEQHGWTVAIVLGDGTVTRQDVTSDPGDPRLDVNHPTNVAARDTDDDGQPDNEEKAYRTNPRDADSDDDGLTDDEELSAYYSEPTQQDTDGDGLIDGLEVLTFGTSPLLADTDGDQFLDGEEVVTDNRHPRLADLPLVEIEIGTVDLRLDVRFEEQTATGTRTLDTKSVQTTLSQSTEDARATENSSTNEWFAQAGGEVCFGGSCDSESGTIPLIPANGAKVSFEAGGGGSKTFSTTTSSTRTAQREYATSLATDEEVTAESVVTRVVEGATMAVGVNLRNASNIAFTISDIQITARIQDPRDPSVFVPVATLFAPSDSPISVGPITPVRGPFRFEASEAFPQLVESLMQNPRGLLFSVANYEIQDEFGRRFAFVEQDINDRTAFLEIDYKGNLPLQRYQIATNSTFDADGKPVGITMKYALEEILGLEHRTATPAGGGAFACVDPTPSAQLASTYSSCLVTIGTQSVETLWRIQTVSKELTDPNRDWWVLTPEGLISPIPQADPPFVGDDFNSQVLFADQDFAFKFIQDLDADLLEAGQEALYRSIDSDADELNNACFGNPSGTNCSSPDGRPDSRDSDRDGIDDGIEVYGVLDPATQRRIGWTIRFDDGRDAIKTFANPGRADTDLDGLTDCQELLADDACSLITVYVDAFGVPSLAPKDNTDADNDFLVSFRLPKPTDPSNPDTDGDGLTDAQEAIGFRFTNLFAGNNTFTIVPDGVPGCGIAGGVVNGSDTTFCDPTTEYATNPLSTQTDGDGLEDHLETRLGTNPIKSDGDAVRDNDGDGLVNLQETTGWDVRLTVEGQAADAVYRVTSNKDDPDSDGDGLTDWEEYAGCRDLDLDRTCDAGSRFTGRSPYFGLVPMDQVSGGVALVGEDSDQDGLFDLQEVEGIPFLGDPARSVRVTDPHRFDTDADGRTDGAEFNASLVVAIAGRAPYRVYSDPLIADDDLDGLSDGQEETNGTDPSKFDTDGENDGVGDGNEVAICEGAVCRDPLVPDQKLSITFFFNVNLDGDLDVAGGLGDFSNNLTIARAGGATFSFDTQQFIGNNTIREVWTASFIKPFSESIGVTIAVYESDSGTSTDGTACRIDDTRNFAGQLSSLDSYSTNQENDFVGDPIAECKFQVDVNFKVNVN